MTAGASRRPPWAAWALPAVLAVAPPPTHALDLPPVVYEGRLQSTARANAPEEGERSLQLGRSASIDARTFIWQPWFGLAGLNLNLSQVDTSGAADSSATSITGEGRIRLFHRSRFPFSAFIAHRDQRTELESTTTEVRDARQTRFGVSQSYRPPAGNASYRARLERSIQDGGADALDETSDHLNLALTYRLDRHSIESSLDVEHTVRDRIDEDFLDVVLNARHGYRPLDTVTVDSFATLTDTRNDAARFDTHLTTLQVNSFASWNPTDRPLTVNASAGLSSTRSDLADQVSTQHSGNARVTATYTITPSLRASGTLDGAFTRAAGTALSSSQSATLSYGPPTIDLAGFQYSWSASTGAANRLSDVSDDSRSVSASIGHGLARVFALDEDGTFTASVGAGQSGSATLDSLTGARENVDHSVSLGLGHARTGTLTRLTLDARDSRGFGSGQALGGGDSVVQSVTAQAIHDSTLGRNASLAASLSAGITRQRLADFSDTFRFSSAELTYQHRRVFGVRRLRFRSRLSASTDGLGFVVGGEERREVTWENRLDYRIGRLEARLTATVTDNDGTRNASVFLTVARRFGGVFVPGR